MILSELIDALKEIRCKYGDLPLYFEHNTTLIDPDTGEKQHTESEICAVLVLKVEKRVLLSGGINT